MFTNEEDEVFIQEDVDLEEIPIEPKKNCQTCLWCIEPCSQVPGEVGLFHAVACAISCPWPKIGKQCRRVLDVGTERAMRFVSASLKDENFEVDCPHWEQAP